MFTKGQTNLLLTACIFTVSSLFTQSAAADSRNDKQKKKSVEVTNIEAAYHLLAHQFENKPKTVKAAFSSPKGKIVKVSYSPKNEKTKFDKSLKVTATAYTSHVNQTDSTPFTAAWGDKLKPGMKVIAVSRDLLNVYGLKHKQKVRIKGLKGEYLVLDKMNKRWRKKIDIYMGMNKRKAYQWGRRKVEIYWNS